MRKLRRSVAKANMKKEIHKPCKKQKGVGLDGEKRDNGSYFSHHWREYV